MSIDFYVTHLDGTEESIPVTNQQTATEFFGGLAARHGFRILTGTYPAWACEADLGQLIFELSVIRDASRAKMADDQQYTADDRDRIDQRWGRIIEFVRRLADRHGWEMMIC